jgi:streptogramin lyase
VSTFFRNNGLATRIFALALFCCAGFSGAAKAQVAPTLLPYTVTAIAGGATATPGVGAACPVSGFKSTSAYGDGCIATELKLSSPRYAIVDKNTGAIFFSDYGNGVIRRIDPLTGVVTTIAGGGAALTTGATCGTLKSLDAEGNGCLSTAVKLGGPSGLAISPITGNLYFADAYNYNVRMIAATGGLITGPGVISAVAGYNGSPTYGYTSNNTTTTIVAATSSYLDDPEGIAFDPAGNLYIADEYKNAVSVVNTTAAPTVVTGITIPAGTIQKIIGAYTTTPVATCPNGPGSSAVGCTKGLYTNGNLASVSNVEEPYAVTLDPSGNIYFANEYIQSIGQVTPAGKIYNYGGIQNSYSKVITTRGPAGSFAIGSDFGIAADAAAVYTTDALNGVIWRIDSNSLDMYSMAGGAATVCAGATDAYGDGCPATQAIFGKTGTSYAAYAAPGIYGVNVDQYEDLLVGDSTTNLIREIASGTQFGAVGANQPTQIVATHFAAADGPASNPFSITGVGSTNFSLGAFNCAPANSDGTIDCTVAVTATPTVLGPFSGTLTVKSSKGAVSNFPLNGTYITSPSTRTTISANTGTTCNSTTVSTTAPIVFTSTVVSTGTPTGTITFFANGTQIGNPVTLGSNGAATLTNTFSTAGTYVVTAKYSGDTNFITSTSAGTTIISAAPTFTIAIATNGSTTPNPTCPTGPLGMVGQCTVTAGQTGLYSFTVAQTVYNGTISFACSGLPAYSSCVFSPPTLTGVGCTTSNTVALSILTQQSTAVNGSALGAAGSGRWQIFGILPGLLLAMCIGIRRRKSPLRFGQAWMALALLLAVSGMTACSGKSGLLNPATPSGSYSITVTATGSAGTITSLTVPLTVK